MSFFTVDHGQIKKRKEKKNNVLASKCLEENKSITLSI